jgi:cyanophycinase
LIDRTCRFSTLLRIFSVWVIVCALSGVGLSSAQAEETRGSLVIIGGGLRFNHTEVWDKIVDLAGGPGAKIAVFPTASSFPRRNGGRTVDALNKHGASAFLVPVGVQNIDVDYREAVKDPQLVEQVRSAGGVFFIGGEQDRIIRALRTSDGKNTPLLDAVWEMHRRGGVVAGSSAGAAIMSDIMCRNAEFVLGTMQNGVTMGREIDHGLGFMDHGWFVEQHCLTRGRFARALVIMQSQGIKRGIGVDDNTALVVHPNRKLDVIGYKGAVLLDLSQTTNDKRLKEFNVTDVRLSYLDRGDSVDLETLAVTPSAAKRNDHKIDPASKDFRPTYDRRLYSNDILGNTTLVDLLVKLMNNKQAEAFGWAFDALFADRLPARGFEFRFYRQNDTLAWFTSSQGGEDYTITNIHLDIKPTELGAPAYRPPKVDSLVQPAVGRPEVKAQPASLEKPAEQQASAGN